MYQLRPGVSGLLLCQERPARDLPPAGQHLRLGLTFSQLLSQPNPATGSNPTRGGGQDQTRPNLIHETRETKTKANSEERSGPNTTRGGRPTQCVAGGEGAQGRSGPTPTCEQYPVSGTYLSSDYFTVTSAVQRV